ncbi:amidohydrolase family protein [Novosphingobium resinovorum]|nr:amidohydrolase family protein [Novosphingobium resinovorum]
MKNRIFSADAHIVEPRTLFLDGLPASLQKHAVSAAMEDGYMKMKVGPDVVHRQRLSAAAPDGGDIGRSKRKGASNLVGRLEDMEMEGIDCELVFPTLGLVLYFVRDREAAVASSQLYNDWALQFFGEHRHMFVPSAMLPALAIEDILAELRRVGTLGYTAAMLPTITGAALPAYNDEAWDPVFRLAGDLGIVFTFHTGTGDRPWISERGPGAAVINYATQMNEGIDATMRLVSGGVLDRNPDTKICFVESGASWLAALAERMDEVYEAHNYYVRPVLSLKPSEIIQRQVSCAFQHDRACIMSREVTGLKSLLWATDYPHAEGTFPKSRKVAAHLFDGIEIGEDEKAAILGGNAFDLFRPAPPPQGIKAAA